ncbi:hypothetical protein [Neobacillus niacini]|uniref:hypothetical protein n=1 Tax=Neobacillus niacini TaxID=86668 RepID=UPI00285434A9|nr:hypothetical protein [Neobacillus niacini]MDR7002596.1 hypothetical protein [Neobacillus niacini]
MPNKDKPATINQILRNVKQRSSSIDPKDFEEIKLIARRFAKVKNYVYSRFAGINSFLMLKNYRKLIRDVWVQTKFADQWKLPARYWKLALDDAISNIKSNWSNLKNTIKKALRNNPNVTEDEIHYIYYILKADELLYAVLMRNTFCKPPKIKKLEIREDYVHQLIRRYIRKYKGSTPYSHKETNLMIDAPMYKYIYEAESLFMK